MKNQDYMIFYCWNFSLFDSNLLQNLKIKKLNKNNKKKKEEKKKSINLLKSKTIIQN